MKRPRHKLLPFLLCAMVGALSGGAVAAADPATTIYAATTLNWQPLIAYSGATLRVVGADGYVFEHDFGSGQPSFSIMEGGSPLPDGQYRYELVFTRPISPQLQVALGNARSEDGSLADPALAAQLNALNETYGGSFTVAGGKIAVPEASESGGIVPQDQVVADDQIVQGSLCVGFDCVNNESFGFDTIRLKENNTRIKFDDTSIGTFPANDWQLTANDSASGGANKFSIEDVTGAKVPVTVTAGAATNSLFIDSTGRVGFRTSTPVLDLHVNTSNTPALRLEQNNSGGFTAQTWDIAGNEANFFVRDVTSGSRLPFRIRPGAPTSSIDIAASGNVGIANPSPTSTLHIKKTDGTAQFKIEEGSPTNTGRNQITMFNNGDTRIRMDNGTSAWHLASNAADFRIAAPLASNQMILTTAGNMTITGTLTQGSSRDIKENITATDAGALLAKVASLPLYSWNYKQTPASQRHVGPIAEEFYDLFQLGPDNKHVAPSDVAGIALGAVQALNALVAEKNAEIQALKERLLNLESRLGLAPADSTQ